MRKIENKTHIEGWLYENKLDKRVTGPASKVPGTEFIRGSIRIATDDDLTNVVEIFYTYETAVRSSGKTNTNYAILKDICDGVYPTVMTEGKDKAVKVRVDSNIGVNDFYNDNDELISSKRNDGGLIHITPNLSEDINSRSTFRCDMVITQLIEVPEDEERGFPEKVKLKGCTFNFRNKMIPIEVSVISPAAMDYFRGLEISPSSPVFTKVWGNQISETVNKPIITPSAFGEDLVSYAPSSHKEWIITGATAEPYVWDDESSITADELSKAIEDRNSDLAIEKARRDAYKASQVAPAAKAMDFKF